MLAPITIDQKTFLREHCEMPALPEVVGKVQSVLEDDDINIADVSELISSDSALVSHVLKIVNSAYYGLSREVSNLNFAIGFLGLDELHRIIMSFSVANALAIENVDEQRELWFHSFHTALCANFLAKRGQVNKIMSDVWSAALLHDLGKLVYLKFFPDHYVAIKSHAKDNGIPFSSAEAELEVPPSSYLGTLLCDHWKLPLSVRDACEAHTLETFFEVNKSDSFPLTIRLVCMSNILSTVSSSTLRDDLQEEIKETAKKALVCDESQFDTLLEDIGNLKSDAELFMCQFF